MDDEETTKKPPSHQVGAPLDDLSIEELQARIDLLESEIGRLKSAIGEKNSSRAVADAVFKN